MKSPLSILIIEDNKNDIELMLWELRRNGVDPHYQVVDNAESLQKAWSAGRWYLVISDYRPPRFSGPEAIAFVKKSGKDVPLIIVSGTIGEDVAVFYFTLPRAPRPQPSENSLVEM